MVGALLNPFTMPTFGVLGGTPSIISSIVPLHGSVDGGDIVTVTAMPGIPWDTLKINDSLSPYATAYWPPLNGVVTGSDGTTLSSSAGELSWSRLSLTTSGDYYITLVRSVVAGTLPVSDVIICSFGLVVDTDNYVRVEIYTNSNTPISSRFVYAIGGHVYTCVGEPIGDSVTIHVRRILSTIQAKVGTTIFPAIGGWSPRLAAPEVRILTQGAPAPTVSSVFVDFVDAPMLTSNDKLVGTLIGIPTATQLQFIIHSSLLATNIPLSVHASYDIPTDSGFTYDPVANLVLAVDGPISLELVGDDTLR